MSSNNARFYYDAFNNYYARGMEALDKGQYEIAERNILEAARSMYQLANLSDGALRAQRLQRGEELENLAAKIKGKAESAHEGPKASDDLLRVTKGKPAEEGSSSSKKSNEDDYLTKFAPAKNPGVSFDDIAGLDSAKDEVRRVVVEPLKHPEIYERFNRKVGGGILLYGAPGTGKTMFAQAVATELKATFFNVKCSDIVSRWFGDAEKNVRGLFQAAHQHPFSIIFFDEFESLGAKRNNDSTVMKRLIPQLLEEIQGFEKSEGKVLVIAATNRPWDIDSAFLRPGRFDTKIYVPLPDFEARKRIVELQFNNPRKGQPVPVASDFSYDRVARETEGFNGSDMTNFCDKLKDPAIARSIKNPSCPSEVTNGDIDLALANCKSSVNPEDIKQLMAFQEGKL